MKKHFMLGSTSRIKIQAVKNVLREVHVEFEVHSTSVSSDVSEQPEGYEETLLGAMNRAKKAKQRLPRCYAMGIENGIRWNQGQWEDWAIIVMIDPNGVERIAESSPIVFPALYVEEARKRGFNVTTVGKVMSEMIGISSTDPHSYLTKGVSSRRQLLEEAIAKLFIKQQMECAS